MQQLTRVRRVVFSWGVARHFDLFWALLQFKMVHFRVILRLFLRPKTLGLWGLGLFGLKIGSFFGAILQLKMPFCGFLGGRFFAKNCKVFGDFCRLGEIVLTLGVWIHFSFFEFSNSKIRKKAKF